MSKDSLLQTALEAVENKSNAELKENDLPISVAQFFLTKKCPQFLKDELSKDEDRLVKIGRSIIALFRSSSGDSITHESSESQVKLEKTLQLIVDECNDLMEIHAKNLRVPTVRFGKTNIEIPVVTMGCMRFQQSWNRHPKQMVNGMDDVLDENQENLKNILRYAGKVGANHIETARMYGSSEMQLGVALQELFESGEFKREDFIVQTKVPCKGTVKEFRDLLETSFKMLQLDYFDLTTFHGLNTEPELAFVTKHAPKGEGNDDETCECLMDVIKEYMAAGKIKHVGFTSHGRTPLIREAVETNMFEYANIHFHYLGGSYTTTGEGEFAGNLENVRLMKQKDMGIFAISPFDKGGRVYVPSRRVRDLTLPDMEPINFAALWLWMHHKLDETAPVHTITCGVARPSDFDQPVVTSIKALAPENADGTLEKLKAVIQRLEKSLEDAVGKDFRDTWHKGMRNGYENMCGSQLGCIAWYAIIIKAFGLVGYVKDRYSQMEAFMDKWDPEKSNEENIESLLALGWGWMPGTSYRPGVDYSNDLKDCPEENRAKILESFEFVHKIAHKGSNFDLPLEWQDAYDMRPWTAWCERPPPPQEEKKSEE